MRASVERVISFHLLWSAPDGNALSSAREKTCPMVIGLAQDAGLSGHTAQSNLISKRGILI